MYILLTIPDIERLIQSDKTKSYESPTIESAGGPGNKVQPDAYIPLFIALAVFVLDYLAAAQILVITELVAVSVAYAWEVEVTTS